jgi:hypothetical protein
MVAIATSSHNDMAEINEEVMQPTIQSLNFTLDVNNQELNSNVQSDLRALGEYFGDITRNINSSRNAYKGTQ